MPILSSPTTAPGSDAFLAAIIEASEDAIFSKGLDDIITSWNPAAERILGYSAQEAIGRPAAMLCPPDRLEEEAKLFERVRRGERVSSFETLHRHKNGSLVEISSTVSPIKTTGGEIIGVSIISRDITAQQRLQDRFRVTLASIGDAVISTDMQGRITFMNKAGEHLTGWKENECVGQPLDSVFRIVNETTRRLVESPVARVLRERVTVGLANHTVLIARDGRETAIDDSAALIESRTGNPLGVVLVFRDISNRREAQLAALRLAAIVDGSDDAIVAKNLKGIVTNWNYGAERIFGYTAQEMIGQSITLLIPLERINEEQEILARLQRGERVDHFETVRVRKDGRQINVSVTISPIMDEDGTIIGASKIARDVTAQKDAERALRQAQAQLQLHAQNLEQQVRERTRSLQDTIAELDAFSYSLSHDLRAPLRAIQGFTEAAIDDFGEKLPAQGMEYLRKTINAAMRMDRLIQDVLSFSRMSREQISVGAVDVEGVLDELIAERAAFQAPRAKITIERPLLPVTGHAASVTQCLSNLLDNAVKFVAPGVVPHVRIWTESVRDFVRVCVSDNGIGIETAGHNRLFRIFERLPTPHRYEGTGIGLAIVRKAAERMHGRVGVESLPGKGSTFWIELPAKR